VTHIVIAWTWLEQEPVVVACYSICWIYFILTCFPLMVKWYRFRRLTRESLWFVCFFSPRWKNTCSGWNGVPGDDWKLGRGKSMLLSAAVAPKAEPGWKCRNKELRQVVIDLVFYLESRLISFPQRNSLWFIRWNTGVEFYYLKNIKIIYIFNFWQ
jgi:hypothetical protein